MRKLSTITFVLFTITTFGQNTFPTSGPVGIGTNWLTGQYSNIIRNSKFVYGSSYFANQIGTGNSVSIGVDVSAIAGSNFQGNNEIILPNTFRFTQANGANTDFLNGVMGLNNGNIGIGTIAPITKFTVAGTFTPVYMQIAVKNNTEGEGIGISLNETNNIRRGHIYAQNGNGLILGDETGYGLRMFSSSKEILTARSNGNVGIGTTNPVTPFHVTGGSTMTAGWNKTSTLQATFPVQIFNSNSTKWGGIGYDYTTAMRFWVNASSDNVAGTGTPALNILNNGNIGIGITSPVSTLHILGNTTLQGTSNTNYVPSILFKRTEGNNMYSIGPKSATSSNSPLNINSINGNPITLSTEGVEKLTVLNNGNIGIGTTTPNSRLEVVRSFRIASNTTGFGYEFYRSDDDTQLDLRYMASNSIHRQIMTFTYNGDVGIGTTTVPSNYKLAVAGNVIADKVKVKKSANGVWPDFVFSPSYKLPNLTEVENFVKQNSHLPEVPSATEIEKEGQDLGEMNRLLLKKVEELTLYLIEQNKEIKTLKSKVELLEKK